jgi:hypothetical protein
MQYIIKVYETGGYVLDNALSLMLGFSMEIKNISHSIQYHYVIVDTEPSKIKRFTEMCRNYMSTYNRRWGLDELKKEFANGKINQKKYDQRIKDMLDVISVSIIDKENIPLTVEEERDDKLNDILMGGK